MLFLKHFSYFWQIVASFFPSRENATTRNARLLLVTAGELHEGIYRLPLSYCWHGGCFLLSPQQRPLRHSSAFFPSRAWSLATRFSKESRCTTILSGNSGASS